MPKKSRNSKRCAHERRLVSRFWNLPKCLSMQSPWPNQSKMISNSLENHLNFIPNRPKWCPGELWCDPGSELTPGYQQRRYVFLKKSDCWSHLGEFGCHFGPSWAPRGSQNRAFNLCAPVTIYKNISFR